MIDKNKVYDALRNVIDPEIGFDIVSLGFVYDVFIDGNDVRVKMTLSSPACPMGEIIIADVISNVNDVYPNAKVSVDITFDPLWDVDMIDPDVKSKMGILEF